MKLCEKCGRYPACVNSRRFPRLCFRCGIGPHFEAYDKERKKRNAAKLRAKAIRDIVARVNDTNKT